MWILPLLILVVGVAALWFFLKRKPPTSPAKIPLRRGAATDYRVSPDLSNESNNAPDHDNWEGSFWDVSSPRPVTARLRLDYKDGAGSRTTRDVTLSKYGAWEGGAILIGHCHLRNATRTFRTDRILRCTDLATGEIITDLEAWLDAKWQASPDRAIEQIIETAWDAIRVLFYVSKADGTLNQKERIILRDAIRTMSAHPAINDARINDLIKGLDIPSIVAFKQAFGRLVKREDDMATKVLAWSDQLVATQKTIAPAEQDALDYMRTRLAKG